MRKKQKESILELLKLLRQLNAQVPILKQAGDAANVQMILEQEQIRLRQIADLITDSEGEEGTPAVPIRQIAGDLPSIDPADVGEILESIEMDVRESIPVRREVVFMPYKAALWDSMESIWKAAEADPEWDAYVVPLPYYDKHQDDSFGELHYEGDLFPEDVRITPIDGYDFAGNHPAVIVIHNPFDEYNFVTSVPPAFFSKKLRTYTDRLVYVPYFESGGAVADTFYELASYYETDDIIIQNDAEREFYAPYVQDKLRPFGSPKYDKVVNYHLDREKLPQEWKDALRGKVYFLNTSLSGVLKHGEILFAKIQSYIDYFRGLESTLIWRPHPLFGEAVRTMRPELLPVYEKMQVDFTAMPNTILDRNPDIMPTISLADAYIGEGTSSAVNLIGALGKPLFLTPFTREGIGSRHYSDEELPGFAGQFRPVYGCPWSVWESDKVTLPDFLAYVEHDLHDAALQRSKYEAVTNNLDGTCGEKTWEHIRGTFLR